MQDTIIQNRKETNDTSALAHDRQLQRVETLTDELRHLIDSNNSVFDEEIIRRQIDLLEHWMNYYRRDIVDGHAFCAACTTLVGDLQARLKLAEDEMLRLEGEGGATATKEQMEQNETLLKAIRRSEKLLTNLKELFPHSHH